MLLASQDAEDAEGEEHVGAPLAAQAPPKLLPLPQYKNGYVGYASTSLFVEMACACSALYATPDHDLALSQKAHQVGPRSES